MLPSFLPWVQTLAGAFPQVCSLCLAHVDVTQAEVGRGREHQLLCDGEAPDPFMPPGSISKCSSPQAVGHPVLIRNIN